LSVGSAAPFSFRKTLKRKMRIKPIQIHHDISEDIIFAVDLL